MKPQTQYNLLAIWLLTLAIVMTPWLSFWTTPVLTSNSQGETVVLCTLKGPQRVAIKTSNSSDSGLFTNSSIFAEPVVEDNERCSALQLKKAFSQGLHLQSSSLILPNYPIQFAHTGRYTFHSTESFNAYIGRAPPLS